MSDLIEYVVILKSYEDLDAFYDDMETPGGNLYIPNREVDCAYRRPTSRSTHYWLTPEEAELVKQDPRVLEVERTIEDLGISIHPSWTQTSAYWDRSSVGTNGSHNNWGLYRTSLASNLSNWGWDAYTGNEGVSDTNTAKSATIDITASGKNVDVIIMDGHMNPDHPEFAVNVDGTGGSRVVQFNWLVLTPLVVPGGTQGTYVYTPYVDANNAQRTADNNHGCHVAGTACGNKNGWARDATIYNLSPYGSAPSTINAYDLFNYIKEFHNNKPVNPFTGIKNPTIVNCSYGFGNEVQASTVTRVVFNGAVNDGPFTVTQLRNFGIQCYTVNGIEYAYLPARSASIDNDITDCINSGIIIVGAAGNEYAKMASSSNVTEYNSYAVIGGLNYYYQRGSSPAAADGVICVGALDANTQEFKAQFSNCGPRVDVFAPGKNIMSSVNDGGTTYDSRNYTFLLKKLNGTSMASPQITGMLACALEIYPYFNRTQIFGYLLDFANLNLMSDKGGWYFNGGGTIDVTDLQGAPNRIAYYRKERPSSGHIYPKVNMAKRPSSGQVFPRTRIYRFGKSV